MGTRTLLRCITLKTWIFGLAIPLLCMAVATATLPLEETAWANYFVAAIYFTVVYSLGMLAVLMVIHDVATDIRRRTHTHVMGGCELCSYTETAEDTPQLRARLLLHLEQEHGVVPGASDVA